MLISLQSLSQPLHQKRTGGRHVDLLRHELARLRHLDVAVAARLNFGGRAYRLHVKHCTRVSLSNLLLAPDGVRRHACSRVIRPTDEPMSGSAGCVRRAAAFMRAARSTLWLTSAYYWVAAKHGGLRSLVDQRQGL